MLRMPDLSTGYPFGQAQWPFVGVVVAIGVHRICECVCSALCWLTGDRPHVLTRSKPDRHQLGTMDHAMEAPLGS